MNADLNAMGARLVGKFGGEWSNGSGMCRCPAHNDKTPSLSVRAGDSALLFKCFAGCTISEIFQALRREHFAISSMPSIPHHAIGETKATERAARRLWDQSMPLAGTPGERYLNRRKIACQSPALRYHPATPIGAGKSVRFIPAILAAVTHRRVFLGGTMPFHLWAPPVFMRLGMTDGPSRSPPGCCPQPVLATGLSFALRDN